MTIQDIKQKTTPFFEEYGITYAALFGSYARGQEKNDSDIDLLIRLGRPMGMFAYMRFINDLEKSLKKKVDVVTEQSLNKFVKPYITSDLTTLYEN